jgi:mannose-1-phosphate guanylyltransferase
MATNNNYAVIMAGGIGSRFWPLSRNRNPKQFLDVLGIGKTLIQQTYERLVQFIPPENIYVIGSEQYKHLIKEQLPRLHAANIISEPARKNTAPCVAYAVYKISSLNPEANLLIAPSDHVIMNDRFFVQAVETGFTLAKHKEVLLTLGIRPTRPDTGYGYIQYVESKDDDGAHKVKTFVEKPTLEIAEQFYRSGDYLWNAGIFIGNVKTWLRAFQQHMPELADVFKEGRKSFNTPKEANFIANAYMLCPNVSIDIGVMEKARNVLVIPAKFDWSDLGTWTSLHQMKEKDYLGNAVNNDQNVMTYDTTNCMIHVPAEKLVVVQGLDGFIVIDTNDVLMICCKDKEQDIKNYVSDIRRKKGDKWL